MQYKELYNLIIQGFLLQGYEISTQCSFLTTLRRWKLSNEFVDLKVVETEVNIFFDDIDEPSQIVTRFAYYNKE
jgi:hypothetical protein